MYSITWGSKCAKCKCFLVCVRACAHMCVSGDFCANSCGKIFRNVRAGACVNHFCTSAPFFWDFFLEKMCGCASCGCGRKNWGAGACAAHYENMCDVRAGADENLRTLKSCLTIRFSTLFFSHQIKLNKILNTHFFFL